MSAEIKPIQLKLGEMGIVERKTKGIIGKSKIVLAPTVIGTLYVKLVENIKVERVKDNEVSKLTQWRTVSESEAKKNIGGRWRKLTIYPGVIVQTPLKQVREIAHEKTIRIETVFPFL